MKAFCLITAISLSLMSSAYSQPYSGPGSGSGYGRDYTGPGSGTGLGRDYTGPGSGTGLGRCRTVIERTWRHGERVTIRRQVCR
jgi:hypothetical protein